MINNPVNNEHPVEALAMDVAQRAIVSRTQTLDQVFENRAQMIEFFGRLTMATHTDMLNDIADEKMVEALHTMTLGDVMDRFDKEKSEHEARMAA